MQNTKHLSTKLIDAYSRMLERIHHSLEKMEKSNPHRLEKAFAEAKSITVHLGELTQDEAELLLTYIKRDLSDTGHSLNESGKVLTDWLAFDWQLVEKKLWKLFSKATDVTRLQQQKFEVELKHGPTYRAHEITGPGSLKCIGCNKILHFYKVSEIPPCPDCQQLIYSRLT